MVLGKHRREFSDLVVAAEADEERDGGIDHALGPGDHDSAPPKAGEPVALAGVVALDPVGLFLADEELALRDQLGIGSPVVGAVETRVLALQAAKEPFE
jgi:hypothetical protein